MILMVKARMPLLAATVVGMKPEKKASLLLMGWQGASKVDSTTEWFWTNKGKISPPSTLPKAAADSWSQNRPAHTHHTHIWMELELNKRAHWRLDIIRIECEHVILIANLYHDDSVARSGRSTALLLLRLLLFLSLEKAPARRRVGHYTEPWCRQPRARYSKVHMRSGSKCCKR